MSSWILIAVLVVVAVVPRVIGPILAGGRQPPEAVQRVIALLGPSLMAALVVSGVFVAQGSLVLDDRVVGAGVGAAALLMRAPLLLACFLAAGTCALLRLMT